MRSIRRTRRPLLALIGLIAALVVGYVVNSTGSDGPHASSPSASSSVQPSDSAESSASFATDGGVALSSLPPQAAHTVALIRAGGPFPYPHNDGVVFHNFEHVLPTEADGYYREYTVPTPGSDDRGARRIVTGKDGAFYYTGDHYDSFDRIDLSE